jgi:hypothetical protein
MGRWGGAVVQGVAEYTRDDESAQVRGRAGASGRRRRAPQPVILPPVALRMTAQRRERAVAALSQLFIAWWQQHGAVADGRQVAPEDRLPTSAQGSRSCLLICRCARAPDQAFLCSASRRGSRYSTKGDGR